MPDPKAANLLSCIVSITAHEHEQIGELESMVRQDNQHADSDIITCWFCGVGNQYADWRPSNKCPFCRRTTSL